MTFEGSDDGVVVGVGGESDQFDACRKFGRDAALSGQDCEGCGGEGFKEGGEDVATDSTGCANEGDSFEWHREAV